MATPIGHGLAGLTVGVAGGKRTVLTGYAILGAVAGLAPDLDFVPGLIVGETGRFHQGPTHSIAAALCAGALVWLLVPSAHRWRASIVATGSYLSHLALDLLTYDPTPPRGIGLLWPFVEESIHSPVTLLPRVLHSVVSPFNLHNVYVAALEVAAVGLVLLAVIYLRRRRSPWRPDPTESPRKGT